jgi:hypothetical protein
VVGDSAVEESVVMDWAAGGWELVVESTVGDWEA